MLVGIRRSTGCLPAGLVISAVSLGLGCGTTPRAAVSPGSAVASEGSPHGGEGSVASFFQADVAPVTALAWSEPFLWIGSERGLRRVRLPAGEAEWVPPESGFSGHQASALAVDRLGRILIATEAGLFRRSETGGHARYERVGSLPRAQVTRLVPFGSSDADDGIWVGTQLGLLLVQNGGTFAIDLGGRVEITSLDLDSDGKSVWVGARGLGLLRVLGRRVESTLGPAGPDALDFVEPMGTEVLANGTRVAVGRGADGGARALVMRLDRPLVLVADPDMAIGAMIAGPTGPVLLGGGPPWTQALTLELAPRGTKIDPGGIRFTSSRQSLQEQRLVGEPDARGIPAEITVAARVDDDIYVGTRSAGVARLVGGAPEYLATGEIARGARSLSVACREQSSCIVATGAGPGWIWDARANIVKPLAQGGPAGGLMAVVGDGGGPVYFVSGDGSKTIRVGGAAAAGTGADPLVAIPVAVEGTPIVTFAAVSPGGNLWLAVRDRVASGQEFGRGVMEVQLPSGRAIHHRAYRDTEKRPPDALPIVGDVRAVRFQSQAGSEDGPAAIWFCTSMGVLRFSGGDLKRWGENEGLDSESCADIEAGADGTTWAATEAGIARFDGKSWRSWGGAREGAVPVVTGAKPGGSTSAVATIGKKPPAPGWPQNRDGEPLPARALVASAHGLWAGTPRGIWPVTATGAPLDRSSGLLDQDVVDLVIDRFGRLWVLGTLGLSMRALPH